MSQNLSSAAVVIGALRVKYVNQEGYGETACSGMQQIPKYHAHLPI